MALTNPDWIPLELSVGFVCSNKQICWNLENNPCILANVHPVGIFFLSKIILSVFTSINLIFDQNHVKKMRYKIHQQAAVSTCKLHFRACGITMSLNKIAQVLYMTLLAT